MTFRSIFLNLVFKYIFFNLSTFWFQTCFKKGRKLSNFLDFQGQNLSIFILKVNRFIKREKIVKILVLKLFWRYKCVNFCFLSDFKFKKLSKFVQFWIFKCLKCQNLQKKLNFFKGQNVSKLSFFRSICPTFDRSVQNCSFF